MKALVLAVFVGLVGLIAADHAVNRTVRAQPPTKIFATQPIHTDHGEPQKDLNHNTRSNSNGGGVHGDVKAAVIRNTRAVVASSDQTATVVRSASEVKPDGYHFEFETDNGIAAQATGTLQKVPEGEALVVQGQYAYKAPDGTDVQITYTANEGGYHAEGPLIPTPVPIPDYIERSLKYIAEHPAPPEHLRKP